MAQYRITVEKVLIGELIVEADNLDEAFEIADQNRSSFEFEDPEWGSVDWDMMNACEW